MSRLKLTLLLFFPLTAFCGDWLDSTVSRIEKKDPKLKNIDQVIAIHPNPRADFTMRMRHSDSNEEASNEFPRYLPADPKSGLLMGFNGHKSQAGNNTLQLAQPKGSHWDWAEVVEENGMLIVRKQPKTCLTCHGERKDNPQEFIPIVRNYPQWEGAYGEYEDTMDRLELATFNKHNAMAQTHSRYKNFSKDPIGDDAQGQAARFAPSIEAVSGFKLSHPGDRFAYLPFELKKFPLFNRRPNANFTTTISFYQAKLLAQRLRESGTRDDYLRLLLARNCQLSGYYETHRARENLSKLASVLSKGESSEWSAIAQHLMRVTPGQEGLKPRFLEDRKEAFFDGITYSPVENIVIGETTPEEAKRLSLPPFNRDAPIISIYEKVLGASGAKAWEFSNGGSAERMCKKAEDFLESYLASVLSNRSTPGQSPKTNHSK